MNAARVIAGIHPPPGSPYANAPLGTDPNAEHPQLAKLIIAGSIELFGDGPFAWRIGSIVFGSLALLGCYALARAAGGGPLVGARSECADGRRQPADRPRTDRDARHLRARGDDLGGRRSICAGARSPAGLRRHRRVHEAGRSVRADRARRAGARCVSLAAGARPAPATSARWRALAALHGDCSGRCSSAGLAILDQIAPPYDAATGHARSPAGRSRTSPTWSPTRAQQTSPHGPHGIASYPWQWLGRLSSRSCTSTSIPPQPAPGLTGIHPGRPLPRHDQPADHAAGAPGAGARGARSRPAGFRTDPPRGAGAAAAVGDRCATCLVSRDLSCPSRCSACSAAERATSTTWSS